jgi:hypothetical protein
MWWDSAVQHWNELFSGMSIPGFEPLLFVLVVVAALGVILAMMHSKFKKGIQTLE